jgi:hypothetical protein
MTFHHALSNIAHYILILVVKLVGFLEIDLGFFGLLDTHQGPSQHFVIFIGRLGLNQVSITFGIVSSILKMIKVDISHLFS